MPHTVVCEALNIKSMCRVESNKGNFNLAGMEASNASQRRRQEKQPGSKGVPPPVPQTEASAGVSRQAEVLVHICRQEGRADRSEGALEQRAAACVSSEQSPRGSGLDRSQGDNYKKASPGVLMRQLEPLRRPRQSLTDSEAPNPTPSFYRGGT